MPRRFIPFLGAACISTLLLFVFFQSISWRTLPQSIGLGETMDSTEEESDKPREDLRIQKPPAHGSVNMQVPDVSPYAVGKPKPVGSNYTRVLVQAQLKSENTDWVRKELGDSIKSGLLKHMPYVVDDHNATLHTPDNKGHEVMSYLTYIIDYYDDLPDITMFMHSHQFAWHNNDLMGTDAAKMIRDLSSERVTREGYMNMRCSWDPGCPSWMHPGTIDRNVDKEEEQLIAAAWGEIFPLDPIPATLAQACCAQFAVSRERIRELPKERYSLLREWLLKTELSDGISGRVFEYLWQYIFTASATYCPSTSSCYCDGYGICFGGTEKYKEYTDTRTKRDDLEKELEEWKKDALEISVLRSSSEDGQVPEEASLKIPEAGKDKSLKKEIEALSKKLKEKKDAAVKAGKDPKQRAFEAGRRWEEGDGF